MVSVAVVISKYCLLPFLLFRLDARRRMDLPASLMDSPMFANNVVISPRPTTQVNIVKSFPTLDSGTKSPGPIVVRVIIEKYKESTNAHCSARPMIPIIKITQQKIAAIVIWVLLRCNVTSEMDDMLLILRLRWPPSFFDYYHYIIVVFCVYFIIIVV